MTQTRLPTDPPLADRRDAHLEVAVVGERWASDDGRFRVVEATARPTSAKEPEPVVLVGDLGTVSPGETLRVSGRFVDHPKHGRRFRVASFAPVTPTSREGLVRYLGSGLVPGVGEGLARRLVERFGDRSLDVIVGDTGRLTEVSGIGRKRADALAEAVRARRAEVESRAFLHGLGLGPGLVRRVLKRFGDDAVRALREDPYVVAETVPGVGFRTADRLGRTAGIAPSDPRRARAAVVHLLRTGADAGHVFLPARELLRGAAELGVGGDAVDAAIDGLADDGGVVRDGDAVYAAPLFEAEREVAEDLRRRATAAHRAAPERPPEAALEGLHAEQAAAVGATLAGRLVVLTGGPGTGKTTTVRAIVAAHRAADRRVLLCAPTGRAAKHLSAAAGAQATTVHRALEWSPAARAFTRDESHPLDADVVLVDEASMLDLALAQKLLRAVPAATTLVLVGDADQLPPVGPGPVLRELLASGVGAVARLRHVFRQAGESAIVRAAHAVLEGRLPEPSPPRTRGPGDVHFVSAPGDERLADRVLAVLKRAERSYGLDPRRDVQVLAPMRRGPAGTTALNAALRRALNPDARPDAPLSPGDRVMQLVNDYDRGVFNGDLGEVHVVEGGTTLVRFDDREVAYDAEAADALTLAYATTVHKAQGSEFPAVVLVAVAGHHVMLTRPWIYTGLTRAKRLAVLCGERRAFARAVRNAESQATHSRLAARLREAPSREA